MSNRKVDAAWEHATEVVEGGRKKAKCKYCGKVVTGITRLKQHLANVGTDVTGCLMVPREVYHEQRNNLGALPEVKIALKGVIGACSEEAALSVYPSCKIDPCETFEEALKAVESHLADKAILPIENSVGGSFRENLDLIYSHPLHIVGEFEASMNFCLLARRDTSLEQLERVLGHSQALEQTKTFLHDLGVQKDIVDDHQFYARLIPAKKEDPRGSGIVQQPIGVTGSTQLSAADVGKAQQPTGVIGSAGAADLYNLRVVARDIHDENAKESITRFWILAKDPAVPTNDKPFKTSLVFTLKEGFKELNKALSLFSSEITLTKFESRPQRVIQPNEADGSSEVTARAFNYLFYIDFEGSMTEPRAERAVRNLKELATYMRILGSYPVIEVGSRTA